MPELLVDLKAVHVHPLSIAVDAFDRTCDICGEDIGPAGEAFTCRLCEFDYCISCFRKGSKLQDWGALRGDKGVKVLLHVESMDRSSQLNYARICFVIFSLILS